MALKYLYFVQWQVTGTNHMITHSTTVMANSASEAKAIVRMRNPKAKNVQAVKR